MFSIPTASTIAVATQEGARRDTELPQRDPHRQVGALDQVNKLHAFGGDTFATAQFGHADLAAKAVEHDPDLLLRGEPPARLATDVTHGGLTRVFLSSRHGTLLGRALALGKVSLNSEPFCLRVLLTGYTTACTAPVSWRPLACESEAGLEESTS